VFLGPSLSIARARQILDAEYAPPVRAGDVYRRLASGVKRIVVIDGLFHGAPSVWHREVVDALDEGIEVVGASSMGALRAAELHEQGMVGIGTVFDWYVTGIVDGDDEVALLHADEDGGYRALSEPLVNIRATIADAAAAGDLEANDAATLVAHAKALPYPERTYAGLAQVFTGPRRARASAALARGRRDVKAEDAIAALTFCRAHPRERRGATRASDEKTLWWTARHVGVAVDCKEREELAGRALDALSGFPSRAAAMQLVASARVFSLAAAKLTGTDVGSRLPPAASYSDKWSREGLTPGVFARLTAERATFDALLDTAPPGATPESGAVPGQALFFDGARFTSHVAAFVVARARPWVGAWCRAFGVECSEEVEQRYADAWRATFGAADDATLRVIAWRALCDWVVSSGPEHFGLRERTSIEVLHDLQLRCEAARLAGSAR
jgi:hypothetical protein